jgi:hypothetical protein
MKPGKGAKIDHLGERAREDAEEGQGGVLGAEGTPTLSQRYKMRLGGVLAAAKAVPADPLPAEPTPTPIQIVEPSTSPPANSTTVSLERRHSLPILGQGIVDIAAEKKKLDKVPRLGCSTCSIGPDCSEFKEGHICKFIDTFEALPPTDVDSVMESMRRIVLKNSARMNRAFFSEEIMAGGQLDMNVTRQSQIVLGQLQELLALQRETQRVSVQVVGDGGPKAPGILSQLFGSNPAQLNPQEMLTLHPEHEDKEPATVVAETEQKT